MPLDRFEIVDGFTVKCARDVFEYQKEWGAIERDEQHEIRTMMRAGFGHA